MPLSIWLAAFALASALPVAWWSLGGVRSPGRRARTNLARPVVAGGPSTTDLRKLELQSKTANERVVAPAAAALARRARRFTPVGRVETLERRIFLAGLSDRWPVERLLAWKMMLGLLGGFFSVVVLIAGDISFGRLLLAIVLPLLGYLGPDYYMDLKARDRQGSILRELPDSLDQITVCVEAGLSFESAVARAADTDGPLADEFGRTLQDIQIGIPRSRALESLLERTDVQDLRTFVHAFTQAERYGIPIAQVLRVQSAELREKRRQRAEERAMKMPVKLVFPVVLCILPALFVVVAGPAVIRISHVSFSG